MVFSRVSCYSHRGDQEDNDKMAGNGRKWQEMVEKVHRGYLVGNGFPRIIRRGHRGD